MDFEDSDRLDTPDLQIYITDAVEVGRKKRWRWGEGVISRYQIQSASHQPAQAEKDVVNFGM
jgi:hypothetical protein